MPYIVRFNHTPEVGYQIIVELYMTTIDVSENSALDAVFHGRIADAAYEHVRDDRQLEARRWMHYIGYDSKQLDTCLMFILVSLLSFTEEDALVAIEDIKLSLRIENAFYESESLDDYLT